MVDIRRLLAPSSVAVVGATERLGAFTGDCIYNLQRYGFSGRIHPVNPRRTEVRGLQCVPSVGDLEEPVDAAVLLVGADRVLPVLEECAVAGIKSVLVAASGFGEGGAGAAGERRRAELDGFLDGHPMTLLGPSTTGLVNLLDAYVPRAGTNMLPPAAVRPGPVAVISQSGASNNIVFNRAQENGLGIGLAVATGLQARLSVWDVVGYALDDDRLTVLAMIVEELGPAAVWRPHLDEARAAGKQIILCKAGTSEHGARAVASHTGAVAGSWPAQRAALQSAGAIVVDDLDQLWEVAALSAAWGPPRAPVRLGAVAMSGGEGALIADQASAAGVALPDPGPAFTQAVAENLTLTRGTNPFDPSGEILSRPEVFVPVLGEFLSDPAFDRVLLAWHVLDEHVLAEQRAAVKDLLGRHADRVVVSGWPVSGLPGWRDLVPGAAPFIPGSHRAVAAVAAYSRSAPDVQAGERAAEVQPGERAAPVTLPSRIDTGYSAVRAVLADAGIPFGPSTSVTSGDEAVAAAALLGWPLVLKADVDSAVHKAASGLVAVGLADESAVRAAYRSLTAGRPVDVIAEGHLTGELQLFLGARYDLEVGVVVAFGTGGGAVEYLGDVVVGTADLPGARRAVGSRAGQFLAGRCPDLVPPLIQMLCRLGEIVTDPRIESVEVNPMFTDIGRGSLLAADARLTLLGPTPPPLWSPLNGTSPMNRQ